MKYDTPTKSLQALIRDARSTLDSRLAGIALSCAALLACAHPGPTSERAAAPPPVGAAAPAWQLDRSTFDLAADPCNDFYQYVCGGFASSAKIPPDQSEVEWSNGAVSAANDRSIQGLLTGSDNADDVELGRLRTYFASCMATGDAAARAGEATLARWLARIDGIKTRGDVLTVVRDLQLRGVHALFQYSGEPDPTDRTRYRGEIGEASFGSWRVFRRDGADDGRREAYRAHIQTMFELSGEGPTRAQNDARAVVELERKLAGVAPSYDPSLKDNLSLTEHPMAPAALTAAAPHLAWAEHLEMVGHRKDQRVNVTSLAYLAVIDEIVASAPLADLRAYLRWQLLYELAPGLPARLADERYRFGALGGATRGSRSDECQLETVKAMGVELSRQFSIRVIGAEARDRATAVAERVRAELASAVPTMTWLSPAARAATEQKIRMFALKVGYPETWPATGAFPLRRDAFLDNMLAAREYEERRSWQRVGTERRRDTWENAVWPHGALGMAAARLTFANGFPDPFTNSIVITAAALRPPVFEAGAPLEVRYGGFGAIVAHELVHCIETHEYDHLGDFHDSWTPADVSAHDARRACVVDQASQFVAFETTHLDGKQTYSENVADLSGAAHAYAAMALELGPHLSERGADSLTPAKRFFITYAQHWCIAQRPEYVAESVRGDSHGPSRYRVNGPLSNMPAFAEAFACPAGAPMVRPAPARCAVW
jgi:endothelin-converting enzyme/putative endopeptidase